MALGRSLVLSVGHYGRRSSRVGRQAVQMVAKQRSHAEVARLTVTWVQHKHFGRVRPLTARL
jgi:hypothetical protein